MVGKRKAEEKLSTNPYTVKARACITIFQKHEKNIELAKRADAIAIIYMLGKLRKSNKYITVNNIQKEVLKQAITDRVIYKKYNSYLL